MKKPTRSKRPAKPSYPLLGFLDKDVPMAINTLGLSLCFSRNLTSREVTRVFNDFPVIVQIETPEGYYLRQDWKAAMPLDPTCSAARIAEAIKSTLDAQDRERLLLKGEGERYRFQQP